MTVSLLPGPGTFSGLRLSLILWSTCSTRSVTTTTTLNTTLSFPCWIVQCYHFSHFVDSCYKYVYVVNSLRGGSFPERFSQSPPLEPRPASSDMFPGNKNWSGRLYKILQISESTNSIHINDSSPKFRFMLN